MSDIASLLISGHRLCGALLTEAHVALMEGDWRDTALLLDEFQGRMLRHMGAEEALIFPRLARRSRTLDAALARSLREHARIGILTRTTLRCSVRRDRRFCLRGVGRLIDVLSCHCISEERMVFSRTGGWDEAVLLQLAGRLSGAYEPRSHTLH